jgi:hypothetical protein
MFSFTPSQGTTGGTSADAVPGLAKPILEYAEKLQNGQVWQHMAAPLNSHANIQFWPHPSGLAGQRGGTTCEG